MPIFSPLRVGELLLPNRIVMAPLGRGRAEPLSREPLGRTVTYYVQRATAGLIVSEATHIAVDSVSRPGTSAIHTDGQVSAWRRVTDAVHAAGGRIFQQHFHLGRKADPARLPHAGLPKAPSAVAAHATYPTPEGPKPFPVPRVLEREEIPGLVAEFAHAAQNAKRAGFDGVELHGANGFLLDQFLRENSNLRTDDYGGSIENRARFLLEVVDAVSAELGSGRVGVRVSPHFTADGSGDSDPVALYGYVAKELEKRKVAYLHLIEPAPTPESARLAPELRKLFTGPLILCGGFERDSADRAVSEGRADLIAFGAGFIANPDLVERLRRRAPWNPPRPELHSSGGDEGYIDYPFLDEPPSLAASAE